MTYPPQPPEPNPYGAAPGGGPAGPPPQYGGAPQGQGDFASEWGIKENPSRPKKVNQLTQLLWLYAAATVLVFLFSLIASATAPWWYGTGFIVGGAVFGMVIGALAVAVAYFITKDKLGAFGATDPRTPLYIGLGILGFFSLGGFVGGWGLGWYAALGALLALGKLAAIGAAFYLVMQPEVEQYLKSRPGNLPKPPHQGPPHGYPPQPPPPSQTQTHPNGYPPEM
jgi:MFS family permease